MGFTGFVLSVLGLLTAAKFLQFSYRMWRVESLIQKGRLAFAYDWKWCSREYMSKVEAVCRDRNLEGRDGSFWSAPQLIFLIRYICICEERGLLKGDFIKAYELIQRSVHLLDVSDGMAVYESLVAADMAPVWTTTEWYRVLHQNDRNKIVDFTAEEWHALHRHLPYLQVHFQNVWLAIRDALVERGQFLRFRDLYRDHLPKDLLLEMTRVEVTLENFEDIIRLHVLLENWQDIMRLCGNPRFQSKKHIALLTLDNQDQLMLRPKKVTEESTPANSESAS